MAKTLLKIDGIDVNSVYSEDGIHSRWLTPLMAAVKNNDEEMARILLDAGADSNAKDHLSYEGSPLLGIAIKQRNVEMAKILLEYDGINVNALYSGERNEPQVTPLIAAVKNDDKDMARTLLDAGADSNVKDHEGLMPLAFIIKKRNVGMAKILLGIDGIDVNVSYYEESYTQWLTPLLAAVKNDDEYMAKVLLEAADIDVNRRGEYRSPLIQAIADNNERMGQLLLSAKGIDVGLHREESALYLPYGWILEDWIRKYHR